MLRLLLVALIALTGLAASSASAPTGIGVASVLGASAMPAARGADASAADTGTLTFNTQIDVRYPSHRARPALRSASSVTTEPAPGSSADSGESMSR